MNERGCEGGPPRFRQICEDAITMTRWPSKDEFRERDIRIPKNFAFPQHALESNRARRNYTRGYTFDATPIANNAFILCGQLQQALIGT